MDSQEYCFVDPEVVRIQLTNGHFIDIKKELNAGEQRGIFTELVKEMKIGEQAILEPSRVGLTKILAYLVGWSLTDKNNPPRPVPVSEAALKNLRTDIYSEIEKLIDAHDAALEAARAERKNAPGTPSASPAI